VTKPTTMHQNLVCQCMRIVANWELDCVKASQRKRLDRIRASTPTPSECLAILRLLDADPDDAEMEDLDYTLEIDMPISVLIDRCFRNGASESDPFSHPLLNCCPDIFAKGMLGDIRGAVRVAETALPKSLKVHEIIFIHNRLFYADDIVPRFIEQFGYTTAMDAYIFFWANDRLIHTQIREKVRTPSLVDQS
jgi:hypothetical protein